MEVRRVRQGCKWRPEKLKGTLAGKKWFVPSPGVTEGEREGRTWQGRGRRAQRQWRGR